MLYSLPRSIAPLGLVFALAAGCADKAVDPTKPPPAGAIGAACNANEACDKDNCLQDPSFTDGYCLADCSKDPNVCPSGSTCADYAIYRWCLDSCSADSECRAGYVCDYGVCRPPCNRQDLCKSGDRCVEGRCQSPCKSDDECTPNRCQDGQCVPPCTKDDDCLPGENCDVATGRCQARAGKQFGEKCSTPGVGKECATGYCLPTRKICSIQCKGSKECPSGSWVCGLEKLDNDGNGTFDGAVAACIPKTGPGEATATCAKDADCATNHCYNGWCMEGCESDAGCAKEHACAEVSLILQAAIATYKGCLPRAGSVEYTLGTFTDGQLHGFDVPSTAQSFILVTEVADALEIPVVAQLLDPNQQVVFQNADQCEYYSQPNRYLYAEQISSAMVPNTSTVKIVPGIYSYSLTSTKPGIPITVKLITTTGKKNAGKIDINWVFLNLADTCIPGGRLDAGTAATHAWFGKLRGELAAILKKANLTIGHQTYRNLNKPALDIITMSSQSNELGELFATTKGITGRSLNVFFVRDIKVSGAGPNGVILGISGGIPGPIGIHGTRHSGLAMSMQTACFEQYGYSPAHTMAHEIGHYLGLFHNMESPLNPGYDESTYKVVCPCPCGPNLTCEKQGAQSWCRGMDHLPDTGTADSNLMYYAAENTEAFSGNKLSPTQVRVMLDNPLVKP